MDKFCTWKKIQINNQTTKPCTRWGHSSCVVHEQLAIFGGFADSQYMNDLWVYSPLTMKWEEVQTFGDIPAKRSNCTLNYDAENDRIVLFGGGGPNKQRFNSISFLDWKTKEWLEIEAQQNQSSPWERTYHIAQFKFPYLIVFAGESVDDMNDLWVYNFLELSWEEVKFHNNALKPCARRFHSSALVNNTLYVFGGCHGKYKCLKDLYSIDLTSLFEENSVETLEWKQILVKGQAIIPRWGHSSTHHQNKLFIFGGRFTDDLNDLLVIDLASQTVQTIQAKGQLPAARRRHCASFLGSSLVCFGGFDGNYFDDLFYINLFEFQNLQALEKQKSMGDSLKQLTSFADCKISTTENEAFLIHKGLLAKHFKDEIELYNFLKDIDSYYTLKQLEEMMEILYKGYGELNLNQCHRFKYCYLDISPEEIDHSSKIKQMINPEGKQPERLTFLKNCHAKKYEISQSESNKVLRLRQQAYDAYCAKYLQEWFYDAILVVNNSYSYKIKSIELSRKSHYFKNLLSKRYGEHYKINISLKSYEVEVFEVLLNYLKTGVVVINHFFTTESWMTLCSLASYFSIIELMVICEREICSEISSQNYDELLEFSQNLNSKVLSEKCAFKELTHYFHKFLTKSNNIEDELATISRQIERANSPILTQLYSQLKFDLIHMAQSKSQEMPFSPRKSSNQKEHPDKENTQINCS